MRDFVYGKDVKLEAYKIDGYYPFACATEVTLTMNTEIDFTTTPDSGYYRTKKSVGLNDWFIEFKSVTVLQDAVNTFWYSWETLLEQIRNNELNIRLTFKDRTNHTKYIIGKVIIPQTIMGGLTGDFSTDSIRFEGTGPLDIDGLTIPTISMLGRFDWITTGAEPNVIVGPPAMIGKTIKQISYEGDDKWRIITSGIPNDKEVLYNSAVPSMTWKNDFDANDIGHVLYE